MKKCQILLIITFILSINIFGGFGNPTSKINLENDYLISNYSSNITNPKEINETNENLSLDEKSENKEKKEDIMKLNLNNETNKSVNVDEIIKENPSENSTLKILIGNKNNIKNPEIETNQLSFNNLTNSNITRTNIEQKVKQGLLSQFAQEDLKEMGSNQTLILMDELTNMLNLTSEDYDEFNFNDLQNIISNQNSDEINENDLKNKNEWNEKMNIFEAAETTSFQIESNESELLYDYIDTTNSTVQVSLFVNDEKNKVDFRIIDPKGRMIYSTNEKIHIFYNFIAEHIGEYIYIIDNKMNPIDLLITFAIHQGKSCDHLLNKENLNSTFISIKNIGHLTKNARFAARLLTKKYDAHYDYVMRHNKNFFLFAMIETFCLIIIFFFQLCYIKTLVNKK